MQLPDRHRRFLDSALPVLSADPRFVGVAAGGSLIHGKLDEQSDLDLVLVYADQHREQVMASRKQLAATLGPLLIAFTGEHTGELRLVICLYGPGGGEDPLHVDLKFVSLSEFANRVEDPRILWQADDALSASMASAAPKPPANPDLEWIDDRIWCWLHYGVEKAVRGELLEAQQCAVTVINDTIGRMAQLAAGQSNMQAQGVRRLESHSPEWAARLLAIPAVTDQASGIAAHIEIMRLYEELRSLLNFPANRTPAEAAVREYLLSLI